MTYVVFVAFLGFSFYSVVFLIFLTYIYSCLILAVCAFTIFCLIIALLNAFEKLSMEISLHLLKSPIPIKRTITPSMGRKSSPECRQWFTQIMETMSLGSNSQMDLFVKPIPSDFTLECAFGEFTFDWKDNTVGEQASYEPLVEYITTTTKAKAKNISNGKGLSGGFFFEVELLTIRPRVGIRNNELRVDHLVPSYLLVLCGRSDVVVWNAEYERPCRTTTRYCIEVKTKSALSTVAGVNGCLREAFLQLIGLNACNPYKSPAVILTDLVDSHHVLYLTRQSNTRSVPCQYNLSIHKFSKFSHALWFAEKHLSDRKQNSRDLFRMDTLPPGSIWSRQQPQEQTQEQLHEQTFDAVEKSESIDDDDQDEYYDNVAIVDTLS